MRRSLAFFGAVLALWGNVAFSECGEETLSRTMQHGARTNSGDTYLSAAKGVARQEHAQLALRTASTGPAVLQVRYSAAPVVSGTPNAIGTTYSFGANDKHMEVTSYTSSRTDYRQLGILANPAYTLLTRFANTGFAANPGDYFAASASTNANTFTPAVVETSTGTKYEAQYQSCTWNSGASQYSLVVKPDRTPDCSGGSPCYVRLASITTNSDPATVSCSSGGGSMGSNQTDELGYTLNAGGFPIGNTYWIVCIRFQDSSSATETPTIASRSVKFVMDNSGNCSYGYEDTFNRCAKR
jgi:hypothetical protein